VLHLAMDSENGQVSSLLAALRPQVPAELHAQFDELHIFYEKKYASLSAHWQWLICVLCALGSGIS
jgi:hypothetical protein